MATASSALTRAGSDHQRQKPAGEPAEALEGGAAGSASSTMTHEGDYVVLFIAKNKNSTVNKYPFLSALYLQFSPMPPTRLPN